MYNGLDHFASTAHLHCSSIECTNGYRYDSTSSEDVSSQHEHQANLYQHDRSLHSISQRCGNSRMPSSMANFEDSMTEIVMDDVPTESEPTSAILNYCKRKFLRPYMTILALVGLNPISTDTTQCKAYLSYVQALIILLIICFGFFLQFLASYRGDRGFTGNRREPSNFTSFHQMTVPNWGEVLFGYIIPNGLHLLGFASAILVCKVADKEQLQNLIERVFLMSAKPKRLCTILWVYVGFGVAFLALLFGYVIPAVLMQVQIIQVEWMPVLLDERQNPLKEVLEFRKLLDHLNNKLSIPVCFFTIMNLSYAFAGLVYLFKDFDFHYTDLKVIILNIMNVLLWLVMGLLPFFTAASVTRVCQTAQASGHHIRVRPFVYHNTSAEDLNSTLLFASSLKMSAKLFRMPVQPNYLCFAILVISVVILTLGMCLNFSLGIF